MLSPSSPSLCLKLAQLSISPLQFPQLPAPSPNEKPCNNTGHRSRERTGCVYNEPVVPSVTIVPFFSGSLSPLLPGLEMTNLWRGSSRGGVSFCSTSSEATSPSYNWLKDPSDKRTCAPQSWLLTLNLYTPSPLLFVSRAIMSINIIIGLKTETLVI